MARALPNGAVFRRPGPIGHAEGVRNRVAARSPHVGSKRYAEPIMLRSINSEGYRQASEWWSWVNSADMLFTKDHKQLSKLFKDHVQPIFDSLGLGVDLSRIYIQLGHWTNETRGYLIRLMNRPATSPFYEILGVLLHELGHVVQEVNMPHAEWWQRRWYTDKKTNEVIERTEWEARMAAVWDMDHRDRNWAIEAYHNDEERYRQDAYLRFMPLGLLAKTRLLGQFPLDAQCNRFADLLLSLPGKPAQ